MSRELAIVRVRRSVVWSFALALTALAGRLDAQTVQVGVFGGYRFGGDLYEEITGRQLDIDGAPSVGASVDVFTGADGLSITFLYSHQDARVDVPRVDGTSERMRLSVDHWHAGASQQVGSGAVRPYFLGTLGMTRFGGGGDSETRFSLAAGGGVLLLPFRHVGARLDGRVYAVFVDGTAASVCPPAGCFIAFDVSVVWQADFTAGLVLSF